ncbi:CreA family protein [Mycetohabitans sp. B8]|uniref:CreA family protein n=1 Tax=Mycetohabitans sp. B8 TaxID=2841845 RepID=UPI001F34C01F|nr:CreA family protein [Mycetohabitans sp. B8]
MKRTTTGVALATAALLCWGATAGAEEIGSVNTNFRIERISLIFKTLHVVRVVDRKRNTLVYLIYSDRVVSGSAKNSVTAVSVQGQSIPLR